MDKFPDDIDAFSAAIKAKAAEIGFDLCAIAESRTLSEYEPFLKAWCDAGMNDKMSYLERNREKRLDPGLLFAGAKSLIVTGFSYNTRKQQTDDEAPIISRYAYGSDYHDVIYEKLMRLLAYIKSADLNADGMAFVDSAPILEKAWAREAGLGWQGKHSIIINKEIGSFFFIGTLILNIPLVYDKQNTADHCGECRLCVDACPTGAINDNRTIDARKCIANLTIENRGPIPGEFIPKLGNRIYGCDRCQEVCPWNRKAPMDRHPEFEINGEIAGMSLADWKSLSKDKYERYFKRSAMGRVKYENLMRNLVALTGSGNR
jgi:epoxyqueuosine reductase